jgi:predicted XRE-type DNA-binding protein
MNGDVTIEDINVTRYPHEGSNPSKIFTYELEDIKNMYRTGNYSQRQLAAVYGVCQKQISKIVNTRLQ